MEQQKGLFEIKIPPGSKTKTLSDTDYLLTDKDELNLAINQNIHNLTKEQLKYLKSLLNLDISIFKYEKLNESLNENPLFFYVARYNLYEGILKMLKQMEGVNPHSVNTRIALPGKNWLEIGLRLEMISSPLLEIEMYPKVVGISDMEIEINIWDSEGFTEELERKLTEQYRNQGKSDEQIAFCLKEKQLVRNLTKKVASEIISYWNLSNFEKCVCYDENVTGKIFSWAKIYKKSIDD